MKELKDKLHALEKFKYPLLIFALGVLLLLFPSLAGERKEVPDEALTFQTLLSHAEGVGEAEVILSENGVVVVCQGAENAAVKWEIIRAVTAYTGFASDKITILKMAKS